MHLPRLSEACSKCGFDYLSPSKPKGLRDEFLEVIGVDFYRCHKCEARYVRVGRRTFSTEAKKDRAHVRVLIPVAVGLVICAAIALYIQKITHHWPF